MVRVKQTLIVIYLVLMGMMVVAPALFIPQFIFGEGAGSVAIIGGAKESTTVMFAATPTRWGNVLLPLFIFLSAVNLIYLVAFLKGKVRRIER